jgi:hypothetical protein
MTFAVVIILVLACLVKIGSLNEKDLFLIIIPTFRCVFWAMHIVRTRYMRCLKCGKCSWNKKVLSNDND